MNDRDYGVIFFILILVILCVTAGSMIYLGAKIDNFRTKMYQEMKDFHGRLCAIEERNKSERSSKPVLNKE